MAADEFGAEIQGCVHGRVVGEVRRHGNDLDVHGGGEFLAHRDQRADAPQWVIAAQQVDVRPHRGGSVAEQQQRRPASTLGDALDGQGRGVVFPRGDRCAEIPHRRPDLVEGQRLVQVRVRLGRSGQQQMPAEVEVVSGGHPPRGGDDIAHPSPFEVHVDDAAVRQRGVVQYRHGSSVRCHR